MKNIVSFVFDTDTQIILESSTPLSDLHCCSDEPIYFIRYNKRYCLHRRGTVRGDMTAFASLLHKALAGELILDASITQDIGYMSNEEAQNKPGFVYEEPENNGWWIGERYSVWMNRWRLWIYNNADGEIIFEVTPVCPYGWRIWHRERQIKADQRRYEAWIKRYKPLFIGILPRDIAQQWLEKAQAVLSMIDVINRNTTYKDY